MMSLTVAMDGRTDDRRQARSTCKARPEDALLRCIASYQIFGYPDDPNSGELRHSTAICSGYVPADQVLRTVLSISRAFGHEEAMDRLSGPEGEGLVSILYFFIFLCILVFFYCSNLASHH